jgi:23S rRNA-/tRNA-specific pseudouridylate synthase
MAHEKSVRRKEPTRPAATAPGWNPERILFEDEWLIVVDKPAGVYTIQIGADSASSGSALLEIYEVP